MFKKKKAKKKNPDESVPKDAGETGTTADQVSNTVGEPAAGDRAMPIFYTDPQIVSAERHAGKSISNDSSFSFARAVNSVPLNGNEFSRAVGQYPIVFAGMDPFMVVAIVGLENSRNLFVSDTGEWEAGTYVPAYVRRYPFIFFAGPEQQFTLGVDEGSSLLVDGDEGPLFKDGKTTKIIDVAVKFCTTFQQHFEATKAFAAALEGQGLLVPNQAQITLKSGRKMTFSDFNVVDEAKFNELPDDVFLDWRKRGWLGLVYCHLASFGNWVLLADRMEDG